MIRPDVRLKATMLSWLWRGWVEGTSKDPGGGDGDWAQGGGGRVGGSRSLGVCKVEPAGLIADGTDVAKVGRMTPSLLT